ncbi:MAG: AMP-dependent synthetase/ligase [Hyphomicrobiaceae bacterium]
MQTTAADNRSELIGVETARTLPGLFLERVRRTPLAVAYRDFDAPQGGGWRSHTWQAMEARAAEFQAGMAALGLNAGDRVAVLLPNGVDWVAFDMAALGLGLVVVPLYAHDSAANTAYILGNSGAKLALLDTAERWSALVLHASQFPTLEHVWIRDAATTLVDAAAERPRVAPMAAALVDGGQAFRAGEFDPSSLATIVYTSGTTGRPKGVMLSHRALLWNAEGACAFVPPRREDLFLSVLPLAHAFERTVGYYLPMMGGSTVAYARSVQDLRQDMLTLQPTVLLAVPRLFERIHEAVKARAETSPLRRRLLALTVSLGWRRFEAAQGRGGGLGVFERLLWQLLDRIVAAKVRAAFGGRLRVAISGGAALPTDVAQFLIGLGVPVVEGYGLTEAAPVVTGASLDDNLPGSVGRALGGIRLKLADRGELLVHSPAVMMGYWKNEAATVEAVDADGWLHTGDIAELKAGRVFIRGRLKEIIVLSTGENVNPNLVEAELTKDTLVKQAVVVGDGRPFLVAILVIDEDNWRALAATIGVDPADLDHRGAKAAILRRLSERLVDMPRSAQVRAIHLTREAWTIESGLLTPTLKAKRRPIEAKYASEIAAMYTTHAAVRPVTADATV